MKIIRENIIAAFVSLIIMALVWYVTTEANKTYEEREQTKTAKDTNSKK